MRGAVDNPQPAWRGAGPGPRHRRIEPLREKYALGLRDGAGAADDGLVATFVCSLAPASGARTAPLRRSALVLGLAVVLWLLLLSTAGPAGAVVKSFASHEYGVEPQAGAATLATPLSYGSGPVVHSSAPYAIYWDPEDQGASWQSLTAGFLEGAAQVSGPSNLENVFAVATQYRDTSGANAAYSSSFRGAYTDVDSFASAENCAVGSPCLSDNQIRAELAKYITANGLPAGLNPTSGPTPIYFVFTPPGTTVCLGGAAGNENCSKPGSGGEPLCSYHSFTTVNSSTVLYAVVPGTAITACQDNTGVLEEPNKTLADVIVNSVADEQIATLTDPLLNGWRGGSGEEVPDKCRYDFLELIGTTSEKEFNQVIFGHEYFINDEFDQAALYDPYPGNPCLNRVSVTPLFTAPTPVHTGVPVTFNTTESVVDLGIAKYHWEFGPGETEDVNCEGRTPTNGYAPAACTSSSGTGSPNPAASMVHTYTYRGVYEVSLTVTDDGGHTETVMRPVTVEGTARPESSPPNSSSSPANPSTTAGGGGTTATATKSGSARATTAILSRSLKSALASGLLIHYSVNEQVAGRFEVLLAASTARRIGLHGPTATGLPAGTSPEIVIGKAILVTTKAGRGMIKIQFGKTTAQHLRRLGKVSLMVRLVARNAASKSATITTVLNTVTLSH